MGLVVTRRVIVFGAQKRSRSAFGWAGGTLAVTSGVVLAAIAAGPRQASAETMQSALARAYQGNPQLNAQRAIVRQSDEGVSQALSGYRPTLSATAAVGRQYTNESGVIPPIPPGLPDRRLLQRQRRYHAVVGRAYRPANAFQRPADRQQGAQGREPGFRVTRDAARDGRVGIAFGRDRLHGRIARYGQPRGAAEQRSRLAAHAQGHAEQI